MSLASDPTLHARTKHIDIQHHFIRERLELKQIELQYEPTGTLVSDIFTKSLPISRHQELTTRLGLVKDEGES